MGRDKWAEVLKAIYENDNYWQMNQSRLEDLSGELGLTEDEVDTALDNLQAQNMIKRDIEQIKLTQRGFDLINRRKDHEEKLLTDRLLLIFTSILTLGVVLLTAEVLIQLSNPIITLGYYTVFAVIFVIIGIIADQKYRL